MVKAHLAPNDAMNSGQLLKSLFLVVNLFNKRDTGSKTPYLYPFFLKKQTSL